MKHGSHYAKRVKKLYQDMVRKFGKPDDGEPVDPIEQLVIGIMASCSSLPRAQSAYRKLRQEMVDLNELRVTPPVELAALIGDNVPLGEEKAHRVVAALNAVRKLQDALDLSFLKQRGRREAREYLEALDGVDQAAAAWVVVGSLGGHAIPVDRLTVYILRKDEIVDAGASVSDVQGFLERHVNASNARAFSDLLSRYVSSKSGRVDLARLEELLNPPPPPEPDAEVKAEAQPEPSAATRTKPSTSRPTKSGQMQSESVKKSAASRRTAARATRKKREKSASARASGKSGQAATKSRRSPKRKR